MRSTVNETEPAEEVLDAVAVTVAQVEPDRLGDAVQVAYEIGLELVVVRCDPVTGSRHQRFEDGACPLAFAREAAGKRMFDLSRGAIA